MAQYYGKYRGTVVDVSDPTGSGRVRAKCPSVLNDSVLNWALPNLPPKYKQLPAVGDLIWIEFEQGCVDEPIWTGCFFTTGGF